MGKTTITRMACDGKGCGKILEKESDGIFIRGVAWTTGDPVKLIVDSKDEGSSYCWACFSSLFPKAPPVMRVQERRPPPPPPPESTYHGEDGYDPYPRGGHKAPTGPLPPPELPIDAPHYVRIAANISGVGK